MTYPKPFMTIEEMAKFTGLSKKYLMEVYRRKDNNFAGKLNPALRNSPIVFDTEKFDQWREKQIKMEVDAMHKKSAVVA